MSAAKSGLSTASRSPTKGPGTARRLGTADTASTRRPGTADRPEERVKVFLRVRPTKAEGETPGALRLKPDGKGVVVYREHASIPSSDFEFDGVQGPEASQSDVYQAAVRPVVEDVLNGFNGTLMAYGQTGAGKTYSLSSIAADAIGMIPRAAAEIFQHIEQDGAHEYSVYMSYVQLYMELIQDLLRPESENLQIRENEGGVFVGGVHQQEVSNITQCLHLLHLGDRNRTTAFTALNAHSSRSHAVLMLTVVKRRRVAGTADAEIQRVKVGKLFLVDLAGSERLKKSKSVGLRASEAKSINLSLTTLGMCINARADPAAMHVPFRDSKLTRLLQDSLGGNAKTSLLVAACDAHEHVEETLQSLQFGQRAMCVRIQAVVNERVDYKTLQSEMVVGTGDRKSSLLEASLLEKDAQLEAVQARLQQEQAEAARQLEALQRERQALEAERARQLQERQAALEAEQAHKAKLLQELQASSAAAQGAAAEAEAQRQALASEAAALRQQVADAAAAAAEAAQQHERAAEEQRQAHAAEVARLTAEADAARAAAEAAAGQHLVEAKQALEEELVETRQQLGQQLEAAQAELARTQQLLKGSRAESRLLQENYEQQLSELEGEWVGKVQEAQAAGERQLAAVQATVAARDAAIVQLQAELEGRDGAIAGLQGDVAELEAGKAELARQVTALQGELARAAQRQRQLEAALQQEQEVVDDLQTQVDGYERSRMNLAKSFFENKVRSDAAKLIQRRWRQHRMRRLRQQQSEGYQALHHAKAALHQMADQHKDLEQRRRANLAFSGQTLVGDNLGVLQDAVESIIAAFVLPARDLKSLQTYKQKIQSGPSLARQSMAAPAGGASLMGTPRLEGLIRAVHPLAESVPNSARSTPRDWGAGGGAPEAAAPAATPLQQQYQQAAAAGAAAYSQQQQQYSKAQLPPGPPLSRHGSMGGAPREGSVRGGLAGLAGKMMGGMGGQMDRLRRLSSGQYQQHQQQQPGPGYY